MIQEQPICVLKMHNIHKSFGQLSVLKGVDLNLYKGEVMALMGENGAGKSTLIKILGGIEEANKGDITLFDTNYYPKDPLDAERHGIIVIHQELCLFDEMNVLDNVFFGSEILKNGVMIDYATQTKLLLELFAKLELKISPKTLVKDLSIGQKQLIEITKALRKNAKILVMDEPTSALSEEEIERIFTVLKTLKNKGVAVVYISHRMQEIYRICDRITVLRDGVGTGEYPTSELSQDKLIELMVGRDIKDPFPYEPAKHQKDWLAIEHLSGDYVTDVSFTLKRGEVLGLGGLMGAGRTSLAHLLIGAEKAKSGSISINHEKVHINHPRDAFKHEIVYISEDRKGDGLWLNFSVGYNISLPSMSLFSNLLGHLNKQKEDSYIHEFMKMTQVKAESENTIVSTLSGGNQQKVAIARALMTGPTVLILDEPTRGIDIGARREIYTLINNFKSRGTAVLLISSDMPELLSLSDRVMVMSEGVVTGILDFENKSPENVMKLAVHS